MEKKEFKEEFTSEQIAKMVSGTYDSVTLVKELEAKEELTEEDTATITRNKEYVKFMMGKEWFVSALTAKQKTELNKLAK